MVMRRQFVRYLLVGGLNTVFGYSVFALLKFAFGWHYSVALFFSTVLGVLFNFHTFGKLVFSRFHWSLLWRFIGVYGVVYAANVLLVFVLLFVIPNVYVANAFAILPVAALGYVLNRSFVYEND